MATTATQQKAAYVLLTSAFFHLALSESYSKAALDLIETVRRDLTKEMTIPTLLESIELTQVLVWPRYNC